MELKPYQQSVIADLEAYLATLADHPDLREAFKEFWQQKGVAADPYKNNVPGVPHVCVKVPTAGGKTFIAACALKPIFEALTAVNPARPQVVVWLVPSLTILEQTVKNLADPTHPYRQKLNVLFRNRVQVYERRELLQGAGFSADVVKDQLSIVVMSFDSLRARNKEDRKIYQDNGYLASFIAGNENADWLLPGHDVSSLINVLRGLKPVVVVDESHNAETDLSVEMLVNLNPDLILDLTATPRNNSNIISYVDAMALKKQHMVKLPVIVANRSSRTEVIESAIILRRKLEELAKQQDAAGGKYIRPIVLFQAQPRVGDNATTYEKVKEQLVKAGIPEDEIKIKTADLNELKGIDLASRDCAVRYIITVNALKEGWDCPNAYILASLADKSSAVDVEQILGRVLRMPHVQQHSHDLLNLSYVFTASNKFADTLQSVVKALNRAGFSIRDYRTAEPPQPVAPAPVQQDLLSQVATGLLGDSQPADDQSNEGFELGAEGDAADWPTAPVVAVDPESGAPASEADKFVEAVATQAIEENQAFEKKAEAADTTVPAELEDKVNRHKLKDIFKDQALALKLPQFFVKVAPTGWFADAAAKQLLERDELLKDFKLTSADSTISFEDVSGEMYRVDLERQGDGDYSPKPFRIDAAGRHRFNELILTQTYESQVQAIVQRLSDMVGDMWPLADEEVKAYVGRIVRALTPEQLRDCLERDVAYARKIKTKIQGLADTHAMKVFSDMLDLDKIVLEPNFAFPETIIPSANAPALPKSLYSTEASMGQFEAKVVDAVANLESVEWWHRNLSRGKGFRINGFLNHYPDFIVKLKSGKVVALETKGDDRDNSDSERKLKLGKAWEAKTGGSHRYMMVFDNNTIAGAETLAGALTKLKQL
ncbi:DEAD/DEAH box helicase [Quatrionicoccus australiensis]|uniref:DEAD/DEAH box helicase n=1 Tax=Quatrionicoccus australiensis TaxID=138118 RepID=UPI001CFB78EA|nr:DEAD/DEAH box helicase family protein [Quatrionicoccus australiensis]MCB4359565.1 DEAD/DEAH box helicase family protein [Quatrionicoccus australiensis]